MPKKIDLTNQRFGKLTVIKESKKRISNRVTWLCKCDCGNEVLVTSKNLREGITKEIWQINSYRIYE